MTTDLNRALERLRDPATSVDLLVYERFNNALEKPLAALLEKAAEADGTNDAGLEHSAGWCKICEGPTTHHAPDCALVAMIQAINGEWL